MKLNRRKFFQVSALSGAALSVDACSRAIPHSRHRPLPGPEQFVETVCGACGAGCGISVRCVGKKVVQIEGIEDHPVNDGGMCPRGIAEIQNLYHPDRIKEPLRNGATVSWEQAIAAVAKAIANSGEVVLGVGGSGLAEGPLVATIAEAWKAQVVRVELPTVSYPVDAMREMLGTDSYRYDLAGCDALLSLGADWLQAYPSPMEAQRAFAHIRTGEPLRGYIATASARLSTTAARSDQWIPIRPDQMALFGSAIYRQIDQGNGVELAEELGIGEEVIEEVAEQLKKRKRPLVVSNRSDQDTQRVGLALNQLLGAIGRRGGVLRCGPKSGLAATKPSWLRAFPASASKPVVILLDANPAFLAPLDNGWADGLSRASLVVSIGSFADESALGAGVILPMSTPLESAQLRTSPAFEGGQTIASAGPAVVPTLYDTRPAPQILIDLAVATRAAIPWKDAGEYTAALAQSLSVPALVEDGGFAPIESNEPSDGEPSNEEPSDDTDVADNATPPNSEAEPAENSKPLAQEPLVPRPSSQPSPTPKLPPVRAATTVDPNYPLALDLHTSLAFVGGLGAHLPYLHGLTDGADREVWRSIAEIHPITAKRHGIENGQWMWVESHRGKIRAVARLRQGVRPDTVAMAVGLGRRAIAHYAQGHGVNPLEIASAYGTTFVTIRSAS